VKTIHLTVVNSNRTSFWRI